MVVLTSSFLFSVILSCIQESKILKFLGFMWNPLSWVMEAAAIMAIALANGGVSIIFLFLPSLSPFLFFVFYFIFTYKLRIFGKERKMKSSPSEIPFLAFSPWVVGWIM